MQPSEIDFHLSTAAQIARSAGGLLRERFGADFQIRQKGEVDLVTEAGRGFPTKRDIVNVNLPRSMALRRLVRRAERRPILRDYEILFILPPDLEEEEASAATERVRASVVSRGGEVKSLEPWGRRRLAYPINRYHEGVYHIGRFSLGPEQALELDRSLKLSEQILRHMILKLD